MIEAIGEHHSVYLHGYYRAMESTYRKPMSGLWLAFVAVSTASNLAAQTAPEREVATFAGAVRDSVTHLPIPKASIRVIPLAEKQPGYIGESDAVGAFRFDAIAPGDYHVQTRGRGFAESLTVAADKGPATDTLRLSATQTLKAAIIELDPEAVITGRVSDPDGEPVPDAMILLIAEQWQRGFRVYKTIASAIELAGSETKSLVIPVITLTEWTAALRKVGM